MEIKTKDGSSVTFQLMAQDTQLYIRLNKLDNNNEIVDTIPIILTDANTYIESIKSIIQDIINTNGI